MDRLEPLFHLMKPHFGQAVTWVLLYAAVALPPTACSVQLGDRLSAATVLSILPSTVLSQSVLFTLFRRALEAGAILWACRLLVPWSCWLTVGAFTATVSFCFENSSHVSHAFNITNMLLLVHAMWYQFYRDKIRATSSVGTFWDTPLYPRWAFSLSVFYIGLFHTWAGVTKLRTSGIGWANGVSLQLWVYLWGDPNDIFRKIIVSTRPAAQLLQIFTLVVETSAILAWPFVRLRPFIGMALLGLYVGIISVFGYTTFSYNALFVALFFLPVERFVGVLNLLIDRSLALLRLTLPVSLFARLALAAMLVAILKMATSYTRPLLIMSLMVIFVCCVCLEGVARGKQKLGEDEHQT